MVLVEDLYQEPSHKLALMNAWREESCYGPRVEGARMGDVCMKQTDPTASEYHAIFRWTALKVKLD